MPKRLIAAVLCGLLCASALTACGNTVSKKKEPTALFEGDAAERNDEEEAEVSEQTEETATANGDSEGMAAPITTSGRKTSADEKDADGKDGAPAPSLTPADQYGQEAVRSADDVTGLYQNEAYTAEVVKTAENELTFTVTSAPAEGKGNRWTICGFFTSDTIRVNYTEAKKTIVYYNAAGEILREETEYENGLGRMQFTGDGTLLWMDEMEAQETIELRKTS